MIVRAYLDESGDCSFNPTSDCRHFIVTVITVDNNAARLLRRRMRSAKRRLIREGWHPDREIKATSLHGHPRFGSSAVKSILASITTVPSLSIHSLVVDKADIGHDNLRNADYGCVYSIMTDALISYLVFTEAMTSLNLICDLRNNDNQHRRHSREHPAAVILGTAMRQGVDIQFCVDCLDSSACYRLQVADVLSWSLFRFYEHGDAAFIDLLAGVPMSIHTADILFGGGVTKGLAA